MAQWGSPLHLMHNQVAMGGLFVEFICLYFWMVTRPETLHQAIYLKTFVSARYSEAGFGSIISGPNIYTVGQISCTGAEKLRNMTQIPQSEPSTSRSWPLRSKELTPS